MHRFIPGLVKHPEKRKITQTEILKSATGTASTIVANVIGGISRNGRRSMHVWLTTTKIMQYFYLRVVAVGVDKIRVQLESGEKMRSRSELTSLGRTSKDSGGLVNFLVY